jgi:serine/threonine protein kinase
VTSISSVTDFLSASPPSPIRDLLLSKQTTAPPSPSPSDEPRFFKVFTIADDNATVGRGAFGSVVRATYKFDSRVYAVKLIALTGDGDEDLQRECKILSLLDSKYIVRYYSSWIDELTDAGVTRLRSVFDFDDDLDGGTQSASEDSDELDDSLTVQFESDSDDIDVCDRPATRNRFLFMQMEFCSGRSLAALLRDSTFFGDATWRRQWRIARGILEGLKCIHSRGIIHRDMKPSNIFIDERGDAKIGDFGLSKLGELTRIAASHSEASSMQAEAGPGIQGSFPYLAPEIRRGAKYDSKSDMYSLGVIFFEMWAYFATESERARKLRALVDDPDVDVPYWNGPDVVLMVVRRLLSQDGERRPSANELLECIPVVPDEVSPDDMSSAITAVAAGDFRSRAATGVLDALFSDSRKRNFVRGPAIELRGCGHVVAAFWQTARLFSAVRFAGPLLEAFAADRIEGVPIMDRTGTVHMLRHSPWHFMVKHVCEKDIRFARYAQMCEVVGHRSTTLMTYDIVNGDVAKWTDVFECVQFAVDFVRRIRPAALLTAVVSGVTGEAAAFLDAVDRSGMFAERGAGRTNECEGLAVDVLADGMPAAVVGRMKETGFEDLRKADVALQARKQPVITSAKFDFANLALVAA